MNTENALKEIENANRQSRKANLQGANLREADLREAALREADLREAYLRRADLREADLREANLREADLRKAYLRKAYLHGANLPAPQMVLLACWGELPAELTRELMRYDAHSHPDGNQAFNQWADGGPCPYTKCRWQRAATFRVNKEHWSPGPAKSPIELAELVLDECCPGWRDE